MRSAPILRVVALALLAAAICQPPNQLAHADADGVWSQWTTPYAPPARSGHLAGYDPVGQRMIVALGWNGGLLHDVWQLSLAGEPAWSEIVTSLSNGGVAFSTGGFDYPFHRLLVVGGLDSVGGCPLQVLELLGRPSWSVVQGPSDPPARAWMAGTVITSQGLLLMHGGACASQVLDDLWLFDSQQGEWRPLHPPGGRPDARFGHTAIYDPSRGRVIVQGGASPRPCPGICPEPGVIVHGDVWSFSLSDLAWTLLGSGPPHVYDTSVYDAVRDRMLVFGGFDSLDTPRYSSDLWAFDLKTSTWSLLHPGGAPPPPRAAHSAVYDPVHDRMIVFGGVGPDAAPQGSLGDTWVLDFGSSAAPGLTCSTAGDFEPGGHVAFTGVVTSHVGARLIHVVRLGQDSRVGSPVDMPAQIEPGATDTVRWSSTIPDSVDGDLSFAATAFVNQVPVLGDTLRLVVHVPVLVRSVAAEAEPGRAQLSWQIGDADVRRATVYRRVGGGGWSVLADDVAGGGADSQLIFVDHGVAPGLHYEYRLGIMSAGHQVYRGAVAVDVPGPGALAVHRVWPNPSPGAVTVAFTLPAASPATLDMVDLSGRLVSSERVEHLGPGTHRLTIAPPASSRSGLYFVRVRQAGRESAVRLCLVR